MATGNDGDGGKGNPPPPNPPQSGDKRRRVDFDPYAISVEAPSDDDIPARVDPYAPAPTPTPAGNADSHSQLQLGRSVNSAEVVRGEGDAPPTRKRFRVDDHITRPRLGAAGIQVEEYLRLYSDRLVDAQRFARLSCGVRPGDETVFVPRPRGGSVELPTREILWKRR